MCQVKAEKEQAGLVRAPPEGNPGVSCKEKRLRGPGVTVILGALKKAAVLHLLHMSYRCYKIIRSTVLKEASTGATPTPGSSSHAHTTPAPVDPPHWGFWGRTPPPTLVLIPGSHTGPLPSSSLPACCRWDCTPGQQEGGEICPPSPSPALPRAQMLLWPQAAIKEIDQQAFGQVKPSRRKIHVSN